MREQRGICREGSAGEGRGAQVVRLEGRQGKRGGKQGEGVGGKEETRHTRQMLGCCGKGEGIILLADLILPGV